MKLEVNIPSTDWVNIRQLANIVAEDTFSIENISVHSCLIWIGDKPAADCMDGRVLSGGHSSPYEVPSDAVVWIKCVAAGRTGRIEINTDSDS